jgi:hypothetical protein
MSCLFALMSLKIVMQKVRKPYELEQRRQDRKKEKERMRTLNWQQAHSVLQLEHACPMKLYQIIISTQMCMAKICSSIWESESNRRKGKTHA